ncbi:MAG: MOSC domain-containing protein [Paracoccaceae bacterium]
MWQGKLLNIHTARAVREPMQPHQTAQLIAGVGVEGDRYATGLGKYSDFPDIREVTLIEIETLIALKRDHDIELTVDEHRRNLTTQDVPLNHLVGRRFRVGDVLLEGGRLNTPCRYLDMVTRKEVCDLLEHRSGLNCRIIEGSRIAVGDAIRPA